MMRMHARPSMAAAPLHLLRLSGTPRDIGRQYGQACRAQLQGWRDDHCFRINRIVHARLARDAISRQAMRYHERIVQAYPEIVEEIRGLAEGAEISYEDALVCQIRRELIGYTHFPARGDCSLAASLSCSPFMAQTIDLAGDMAGLALIMRIDPEAGPSILMFSFAGMLGYLGMNSRGLAVGINLVLGGDWTPGVPPYLLVRRLLSCSSVEEGIALIEATPRASSRALTLMDAGSLATVEFTVDTCRVLRADPRLFHTNHFLHPDLRAMDAMNVFGRGGSMRRLQALQKRASGMDGTSNAAAVIARLFGHEEDGRDAVCVRGNGDIRVEATVGTVCMQPCDGVMTACRGSPHEGTLQEFSF